jgi:hypothetical protein
MRHDRLRELPSRGLYLIAGLAVLLGLWGRFKGLGLWPLHADEYYIARSVGNILRTGLPEYSCGGFYVRGLAVQYVVALLQWAGMTAELSARSVAAVCSVLALPAVYILGVRVGGRNVALLAVSVMAISVWEVDIARFGRMYAPFQAVFVWYLVFFLQFAVDRDARALRPMLLLSLLGVFTWEGGLLLMAVNLLPPFLWKPTGKFVAAEIRYLLIAAGLLIVAFLATRGVDFRVAGTNPFPAGYVVESARPGGRGFNVLGHVTLAPSWIVAFAVVGVFAVASLRWIWSLRRRWPVALGLLVAVVCALAHQFSAVAFVITILLLAGMLHWRELCSRESVPFIALIVASAIAWAIGALGNPEWLASLSTPWGGGRGVERLAYEFFKVPDILGVVALPWARNAPILGAMLFLLLGCAALRILATRDQAISDERVILLLIVCLLVGASMSHPPRFETRYTFFLFPAAMVVAIAMVNRLVARTQVSATANSLATAFVVAAALYVSGDLQPSRLLAIDTAEINFGKSSTRGGYSNTLSRSDVRGAAWWLDANARGAGTLTVNGFPGVDYYFNGFDFAYIDRENQRYESYACNHGTVERWGNLPLVSSVEELKTRIADSERVLMVIDTPSLKMLSQRLASWPTRPSRVRWVSIDGYITIIEIAKPADKD